MSGEKENWAKTRAKKVGRLLNLEHLRKPSEWFWGYNPAQHRRPHAFTSEATDKRLSEETDDAMKCLGYGIFYAPPNISFVESRVCCFAEC